MEKNKKSKFNELALEVSQLVTEKNIAYGNSFDISDEFLKLLWPNGVPVEQYGDMLCLIRIFDKLKRIATNKHSFSEDPYKDILGYCLLALNKESENK